MLIISEYAGLISGRMSLSIKNIVCSLFKTVHFHRPHRAESQTNARTFSSFKSSCKCSIEKSKSYSYLAMLIIAEYADLARGRMSLSIKNIECSLCKTVHFHRPRYPKLHSNAQHFFIIYTVLQVLDWKKKIIFIFGNTHYSRICRSCPRPNGLKHQKIEC